MKEHELAEIFPLLEGEEFDKLVESIEENGQREPIILCEGKILDGMNRQRACEKLGINPIYKNLPEDDDPLDFIIDMNIRRRHLNQGQKAFIAAKLLPYFEKKARQRQATSLSMGERLRSSKKIEEGKDHLASEDAAQEVGINARQVQKAKRIEQDAPEKVVDIVSGKTTLNAVDSELRKAKAEEIAQENKEKGITKEKEKRESKEYKAYLEATKTYKHELEIAISYAGDGLLPPESRGFINKRHEEIYELMAKLEDTYGC